MKSFSARTLIRATPDAIWSVLTAAPGWVEWNTTVERVEGIIAPGQRVKVYAKISQGRAFPVRVTAFEPGRRMVWTGGMPLGLFRGLREFTLTPRSDGHVEFAMRETFSGLLAPLITRSIPDLQPSFEEFAAALKRRVERA
jgi:hypothetical protein